MKRRYLAILAVFATLVLTAMFNVPVHAQEGPGGNEEPSLGPRYVVTWTESDGTDETTGPMGEDDRDWTASPTTNTYSSGSISGGSFNGAASTGTCSTEGTMEATFTWDDDGTGLPPPPVVVLKEVASASRSGQSGDVDCGLTPVSTTNSDNVLTKTATKYSIIPDPGSSFSMSIDISADASLSPNSGTGLLAASVSASYSNYLSC